MSAVTAKQTGVFILKVVICGSYGDMRRFSEILEVFRQELGEQNVFPNREHLERSKLCIKAHHCGNGETEETIALRSELMKVYFDMIDQTDLVVVINEKRGKEYYGVGTTMELGYAFARGKKIRFVRKPMDSNILSLLRININQFV